MDECRFGRVLLRSEWEPAVPDFQLKNCLIVVQREDKHCPFVVWTEGVEEDGRIVYASGSYCNTLHEALQVYERRCEVRGLKPDPRLGRRA